MRTNRDKAGASSSNRLSSILERSSGKRDSKLFNKRSASSIRPMQRRTNWSMLNGFSSLGVCALKALEGLEDLPPVPVRSTVGVSFIGLPSDYDS